MFGSEKLLYEKKRIVQKAVKLFNTTVLKKSLTGQWLWKATLFSIVLSKKKAPLVIQKAAALVHSVSRLVSSAFERLQSHRTPIRIIIIIRAVYLEPNTYQAR